MALSFSSGLRLESASTSSTASRSWRRWPSSPSSARSNGSVIPPHLPSTCAPCRRDRVPQDKKEGIGATVKRPRLHRRSAAPALLVPDERVRPAVYAVRALRPHGISREGKDLTNNGVSP